MPDGANIAVSVPEVESQKYQVLGYLDDDASGTSNAGDPVTFPKDAFFVPTNMHAKVEILFDYIY